MAIEQQGLFGLFRLLLGAPRHGVADKKLLVRSFQFLRRGGGHLRLQGLQRDGDAAQIRQVFAQRMLAVHVPVGRLHSLVQGLDLVRHVGKRFGVRGLPPRSEISFRIVFPSVVVKSVRNFVSDGRSDAAQIPRTTLLQIEERRL